VNRLLAIDWGTSSLRGALLDAAGRVLEERAFARGILSVAAGEFPSVFESCFGDWMTPGTLCLISGMAGSQQGWREAPYCACPAGFDDIASRLEWVDAGRIAIVPGLCIEQDGIPDVMRGEETQVFGALQLLGLDHVRLLLPGTHSKWVTVTDRRVTEFSTWMTGEFYALLHTAFSARTLALFKRMSAEALPSYLSGLLIGEELKSQNLQRGDSVVLMGSQTLTARYEQALTQLGVSVQRVGDGATWRGLRAIADTLSR
jgi:2-dehydro-3-deoxygalactonokinase